MNKRVLQFLFWLESYKLKLILIEGIELYQKKKGKDVEIIKIINYHIPTSNN